MYVRQYGIKAAARAFRATARTVRKWLRRWEGQGLKGLQELSRAPPTPVPHKIGGELAQRVGASRRRVTGKARLATRRLSLLTVLLVGAPGHQANVTYTKVKARTRPKTARLPFD